MIIARVVRGGQKKLVPADKLKKQDEELYDLLRDIPLGEERSYYEVHGVRGMVTADEIREDKQLHKRKRKLLFRLGNVHPREVKPEVREKMCGDGLQGKARRLFLEEGMTLRDQQQACQLEVAEAQARAMEEYYDLHPEERKRKEARREERKHRKEQAAEAQPQKPVIAGGVGPKEVAEQAELTPGEVRKFLRAKNIGKRGGRYVFKPEEAAKIARAAKKHYATKEES